jgi:hypothetical protein
LSEGSELRVIPIYAQIRVAGSVGGDFLLTPLADARG